MYKIIGADQKEYGPVTGDQIRNWVKEGRANAQTKACAEGSTEWKPLGDFPELASAFEAPPAPPLPPSSPPPLGPEPFPRQFPDRYNELNIGSCLLRSWELVKNKFWPVIGASALVFLVMGVVIVLSQVLMESAMLEMKRQERVVPKDLFIVLTIGIVSTPFITILLGGLFKYYLRLIRGERATVGDAFSGFSPVIGQLVLLGLVQTALVYLGLLLCIVPGIYLGVAWYFALPLVIDREMNFWDAMELSRRVVTKQWFLVFALLLIISLLGSLGLVACCVGYFVTMPIAFLAVLYAYQDLFGSK